MRNLNHRTTREYLRAPAPRASLLMLLLALTACGGGADPANPATGMSPHAVDARERIFASATVGPTALSTRDADPATVECKDSEDKPRTVKPKTITIYNNTDTTIYPAILTSKNAQNEWVQGCFRTRELLPTNFVYKLYVNEGTGIPQNSSVEITLPVFSKLSQEQYITWWNGGRVLLADKTEGLRKKEDTKISTPDTVRCTANNTSCQLTTYSSDVGFPENVYAQLSEYTFGDSFYPPGQATRILNTDNVGYNISYVDHVYLPVAIGPKNNSYIGYSGSTQPLALFRNRLDSFLKSPTGGGWPVYNMKQLKLPGGYNIFAQRDGVLEAGADAPARTGNEINPPLLTTRKCQQGLCTDDEKKPPLYGAAIQRMQNLFGSCVAWDGEDTSKYVTEKLDCPQDLKVKLGAIKLFFAENHRKYLQLHVPGGTCKSTTPEVPQLTYYQTLKHVYGWVPFNEGCGAGDNALADTAIAGWNHGKLQQMYIEDLQYNHQSTAKDNINLTFNPYVKLIHDDLKMNAYAFSVDDAVGFMSELGSGLIFTVGGPKGLENKNQFDYKSGFSVAIGNPTPESRLTDEPIPGPNTALIKKYGVCFLNDDRYDMKCNNIVQDVVMPANSKILAFRVGTLERYPINVRFTDFNNNVYTFGVKDNFAKCPANAPLSQCPTDKEEMQAYNALSCRVIDSAGNRHRASKRWCESLNPNQQKEKQLTFNYLSFGQPADFLLPDGK